VTYKRVKITETVYVNTGGGGGSTSTSDALFMYAKVKLDPDVNATPTDSVGFYAKVGLPDTAPAQSDAVSLYAKVNLADTAPAQSDLLARLGITGQDANNAPDDAITKLALAGIVETNATPTDTVKTGFAGPALQDVATAPTDGRSAVVSTWGATQTNTNATNPANALGQSDGVFAAAAGTTGLSPKNATLTITIPVASIPASSTGYTLRMYATGTFALLTTLTAAYTNTGGTPASGTIASGANVTAATTDVALTTIGTALSVTFNATGSLLAASSWSVDAVCVIATPTF
jgi:hypothetical protein